MRPRCVHRWMVGFLFLGAAFALVPQTRGQEKTILAVMEIEDKSGALKANELENAGDYLRGQLVSTNEFKVVDRGRMQEKTESVVRRLKKDSWKECYDEQCRIELGRELAADTIMNCRVTALGKVCSFACELIPLATAASESGGLERFDCTLEGLAGAIDKVVAGIAGRPQPAVTVAPVVKPTVVKEEKQRSRTLEWALVGVGAGLLAMGGGLNYGAYKEEQRQADKYPVDPDNMETYQTLIDKYNDAYDEKVMPWLYGAYGFYAAGGILLTTGVILFIALDGKGDDKPAPAVAFIPVALPDGAGFSFEMTF